MGVYAGHWLCRGRLRRLVAGVVDQVLRRFCRRYYRDPSLDRPDSAAVRRHAAGTPAPNRQLRVSSNSSLVSKSFVTSFGGVRSAYGLPDEVVAQIADASSPSYASGSGWWKAVPQQPPPVEAPGVQRRGGAGGICFDPTGSTATWFRA